MRSEIHILNQEDWVQKFHLENKIDINLQVVVENESTKIEIDEIPNMNNSSNKRDSYLQSIMLSSEPATICTSPISCTGIETCTCYKCQRQKRRIVNHSTAIKSLPNPNSTFVISEAYTPLKRITKDQKPIERRETASESISYIQQSKPTVPSPKSTTKRSNTLRKRPTLKSYEKHLPKPAYSQDDCIYRMQQNEEEPKGKKVNDKNERKVDQSVDNYQIAWKDDQMGHDILTSFVTFQAIFEEEGNDNKGLSDLLERRTKELKYQKQQLHDDKSFLEKEIDSLPPRLHDCLTMSYRQGPKHNPLTLYHTMKMRNEKERLAAYNLAFEHCINANSGMKKWVKRTRVAPTRQDSKLIRPIRASTIKRTLLNPLSSKRNKREELSNNVLLPDTTENYKKTKKSAKISMNTYHLPFISEYQDDPSHPPMRDVLSAAYAFLPTTSNDDHPSLKNISDYSNKIQYEHIDIPGRPRHILTSEVNDNASISSSDSGHGESSSFKLIKSRPGRLLYSLGRKASIRSSNKSISIL
ncbi:uncharacterized protein BX663DRAFT_482629 [Cokeromyces recurvatus]|uniref:uncharacterized protein n=1 Tax=Cokeromyces recurvatus TaxID=90255 RepID=UPI00221F0C92|nr:uncharacterized protein BX663DRAFT_482629 [Cokeromyces recurvatus]KAI7906942.1 hypothetical protein BX663DRAFT_482629 [Cokeromyces recurvatus]